MQIIVIFFLLLVVRVNCEDITIVPYDQNIPNKAYKVCDYPPNIPTYRDHWETSRDLISFLRFIPDFFNWLEIIKKMTSEDRNSR